eukprot:1144487-Pelagomonas_calceolata.AAC.5
MSTTLLIAHSTASQRQGVFLLKARTRPQTQCREGSTKVVSLSAASWWEARGPRYNALRSEI